MSIVWRKSSYSTAVDDNLCVELASFPSSVAIRDSKNPHLGHLVLSVGRFAGLVDRVKRPGLST